MFEELKIYAKDKGCFIFNLHQAREALASRTSIIKISLEEFQTFFSEFFAKDSHIISEQEFSDLIANYEDELLQLAGIKQIQTPLFIVNEEDSSSLHSNNTFSSGISYFGDSSKKDESFLAIPPKQHPQSTKNSTQTFNFGFSQSKPQARAVQQPQIKTPVTGQNIAKIDHTSKKIFIEYMSQEQKDPETVLQDIVDEMVDNQKYKSYLYHDEWMQFFFAMKKVIDQICKKTSRLEDETEGLRQRLNYALAEKEDWQYKYNQKDEQHQKLQVDYDTLEKDVDELFMIERKFNEMKSKQNKLLAKLDSKRYKLSQLKPRIYQLEQENQTLKSQKDDLDEQLYEAEVELEALRVLFRDAENPDLQKKYQTLRGTMRASMVKGGRATAAITRLSNKFMEDNEMTTDIEQGYLNTIQALLMSKNSLEDTEKLALKALAQEYVKNKHLITQMMDQAEEICAENDVKIVTYKNLQKLFTQNEELQFEVEKRRKINIEDRKQIESLIYELKKASANQEEVRDSLAVMEFKFLNQELIQKHEDNDHFRDSYAAIMSFQNKERFDDKIKRLSTLKDDHFKDFDHAGTFMQEVSRGTLGADFDPSRFTHHHGSQSPDKVGQNEALAEQVKQRALTQQNELLHFTEEDDYYDPLKSHGPIEQIRESQMTSKSEIEEEEKDEVGSLHVGSSSISKRNLENMIVKEDKDLFGGLETQEDEQRGKNNLCSSIISRQSQAMQKYEKQQKGKKLKDIMARASRFTRITLSINNLKEGGGREQSIIAQVSRITNFDYLSLRSPANKLYKRISQFLERNGESKYSTVIFSDYMYKIGSNLNKTKRILLCTQSNIYQLSLNLSLIVKIPIKEISGITLIKTSSAMLAIHSNKKYDFLMETVRRTELIVFLINIVDNNKWPRPELIQSSGLKLLKTKKEEIVDFDPAKSDMSKHNKTFLNHLISTNFLNASTQGYLDKRSENWFKTWSEKFCVLTNVGLLYYNDPQKRPRNLFPTIDAQIIAISEGMYNRKYVFQMKSFTYDITFACKSKEDYERWMDALRNLQKETEQRRKDLMKKQNLLQKEAGLDNSEDRKEIKLIKSSQLKKM